MASTLATVSAQDMIKAMIAGQRDPRTLAALARGRMKAKHDDLVEALDGMFDHHHGELAALLLDQITILDAKIAQLSARAAELTAALPAAWGTDADGTTGPGAGTGPDAPVLHAVARLAQIPGLSPDLARAVIAETGLDMTRFPTAAHLVSWAGLCPSARQSGPRTRAAKKGQGDTWLRGALGQAATGAARTATFLGERYHRIARRRGKAKAQVAVARSILVIISPARRSRRPVHRPRSRLLPDPHRHRPETPQPHPADPGPRLRHHHHPGRLTPYRRWPGPATVTGPGPLPHTQLPWMISGQMTLNIKRASACPVA
ncbi:MAG: transposase [Streptosporangiaceae bacterium]